MPGFERLWENGPLFAQAEHFRLSTDCVLLADFVNTAGAVRGIDLGCASGAIALLLLARTDKLHMTGLEIVPEAASLAEENMRANARIRRTSATTVIQRPSQLARIEKISEITTSTVPSWSPP